MISKDIEINYILLIKGIVRCNTLHSIPILHVFYYLIEKIQIF